MSRPSWLAFGAAIVAAAVVPSLSRVAGAGEPPMPAPAAAEAVATPRLTAVEAEVKALEHVLAGLRRTRTDLRAGRSEAVAEAEEARKARDTALRLARDVVRYEVARAKSVDALAAATAAKDEGKAGEARAALAALDQKFLDVVARATADARKADAKEPEKDDATAGDAAGGDAEKAARKPRATKASTGDGAAADAD